MAFLPNLPLDWFQLDTLAGLSLVQSESIPNISPRPMPQQASTVHDLKDDI